MAQVLVRDVDPTIVDKLKIRARQNNRSLEAELRTIVESAVNHQTVDIRAEVYRVRALFAGRSFGDSATLVREVRER